MVQSSSFLLLLVFSSVMIYAAPFDHHSDSHNIQSDEKTLAAPNCDFNCMLSHLFPGIDGGNKGTEHEGHGLSQIVPGSGTGNSGNPLTSITGNAGNPVASITGNLGNPGTSNPGTTGNTGNARTDNTGNSGTGNTGKTSNTAFAAA